MLLSTTPAFARDPLLIEGKHALFQRVITRPGAALTPTPDAAGGRPIPGFTVFYVYDRQGGATGSVQVGRGPDGRTDGWLPAGKTIDWDHIMIGAFTNAPGRAPVAFLDGEPALRDMLLSPDPAGASRRALDAARAGQPSPVVATEPFDRFVDIDDRFYLLPILHADLLHRPDGRDLRELEVASVPAEAAPTRPAPPQPAPMADLRMGLVFVVDTTMSMQPYIDRTREAIRRMVSRVNASPLRDNFRFGIIGFRDSLEDSPDLEYTTRIFAQPDFSKPADDVLKHLGDINEAKISSAEFDEDPIAGLKAAIDDIDWSAIPEHGRYVVLITDAGARLSTDPHSVTHLNIDDIRGQAEAKKIDIFVMHLLTDEGRRLGDHPGAQAEYRALTGGATHPPFYFPIDNGAADAFLTQAEALSGALLREAAALTGHAIQGLPPSGSASRPVAQAASFVAEALRLSYLGHAEQTQAPDVVHSWTTDRDLANPDITSLEVRVLLTRNQLSDLSDTLNAILRAGMASQLAPDTFFARLRDTLLTASRTPERIAQARALGDMLGEYLDGLPYHSQLMDITQDQWAAMGTVDQFNLLNDITSKLRNYEWYERQSALWHDVAHTGVEGEKMIALRIDELP
jgi:hypothetical protein